MTVSFESLSFRYNKKVKIIFLYLESNGPLISHLGNHGTFLCVFSFMFQVCHTSRERFVSRDQDPTTRSGQLPY